MKVMHLSYGDLSGGASIAAYRIHEALRKSKIKSLMYVEYRKSKNNNVKVLKNKIAKKFFIKLKRFLSRFLIKLLNANCEQKYSLALFNSHWVNFINDSNVDLIHLHWIQNEMLSIKDITKIKKPLVWTLHDMWAFSGAEHCPNHERWCTGYNYKRSNYSKSFDFNRWTWLRKKKLWKKPLQIVTPSKWLTNCVKKSSLMKNWPVSTIPNPLDIGFWKPVNKRLSRERFSLPKNIPLILFGAMGGTKNKLKGFDLLMLALKKIKKGHKNKKFELVTFGSNIETFKADLDFPIHNVGHVDNNLKLKELYSAVDVMVAPSRMEAFGQTASESQACGTPVVCFNLTGLKDIVVHQHTGYLARHFNTQDLADGIIWTLDNLKKKNFKQNCIKQAKRFSYNKIAKDYLNIYKKITS